MDPAEALALTVTGPLTCAFIYLLAVFSFGFVGDLAARQSMYPARLFTLPVTTAAMAGWPMLYGTAAVGMLWVIVRAVAVIPAGLDVPVFWPALLAMAILAWSQALLWMPYGLPGLRVVVAVLLLTMIDVVVLLAVYAKASELAVTAFLAPQLPLAALVAHRAVARARRGDTPDWRGAFTRLGAGTFRRSDRPFESPASALAWFEWRRHGRTLPVWVAILLPFELVVLWAAGDSAALVFAILFAALLTPPVMAGFAAVTIRKASPDAGDPHGVASFLATRPVTSAALIAAKLRMTLRTTAVAWLVVAVAVPLGLLLSDTFPVFLDRMQRLAAEIGAPRTIVLAALVIAGLVASTWKQLVQGLWIGLSGNERLVNASIFMAFALFTGLGPVLIWLVEHRVAVAALIESVPRILAVLVALKMAMAVRVVSRLHRTQAVSNGVLAAGAAAWLVSVLLLFAILTWLVLTPLWAAHVLMLVAILAVPLVRLGAAPLALVQNRHW
jgi:hypothetical protein